MRDISVDLNNLNSTLYYSEILRQGEHNASQILITLSDDFIGYTYKLSFKLNDESVYITGNLTPVNNVITYPVTNALTHDFGTLKCELQAYTGTTYLAKSAIFPLKITPALEGIPIELPEDYETYIQVVNHYMDKDIYDPNMVSADVFSMDNMVEGVDTKIMTSAERQKLAILGGGTTSVEFIDLALNPLSDGYTKGRVQWSEDNSTATIGLGNVKLELNQAQFFKAKNVGATTLNIGQAVAITGSDGIVPHVTRADANGDEHERLVVGVTSIQPVIAGDYGYFLTNGVVHKVDTLGFAEGDKLWLSEVNGLLTNVMPVPPASPVFMGWCLKQGNADEGMIYISVEHLPIADTVLVQDIAGYFTAETVEDALAEIGLKITPAHGEIYISNGSTPQSIPVGTTYTKITPFMANGEYVNCTPDATNQRIMIVKTAVYKVDMSFSSVVDTNNTILNTALFKNGVIVEKCVIERTISSGAPSAGSVTCILRCNAGDILDMRCKHNKVSPVALTTRYGSVNVFKIIE